MNECLFRLTFLDVCFWPTDMIWVRRGRAGISVLGDNCKNSHVRLGVQNIVCLVITICLHLPSFFDRNHEQQNTINHVCLIVCRRIVIFEQAIPCIKRNIIQLAKKVVKKVQQNNVWKRGQQKPLKKLQKVVKQKKKNWPTKL